MSALLVAGALTAAPVAHAGRERLVVMELEGDAPLVERVRLAEAVRFGASAAVNPRTVGVGDRRELSTAVNTLGPCTTELPKCATKYGRAMSALYVVLGEVRRFPDSVEVDLIFVDAARGKVLVEATASGRTLDEARKRVETVAKQLVLDGLKARKPRVAP